MFAFPSIDADVKVDVNLPQETLVKLYLIALAIIITALVAGKFLK